MLRGRGARAHPPRAGVAPASDGNRGRGVIPDDPELRRALDTRSGRPSDEYLARLRHGWANERLAGASSKWMPAVAVVVVTVLTATSVAAVVGYRQAQRGGLA